MKSNCMVVIDDLVPIEAKQVIDFLLESIDNGDLSLCIQDCITAYPEVKFHEFDSYPNATWRCKVCGEPKPSKIHQEAFDTDKLEIDE